ncbi:MAG: helix-turn-helix domain-containing protein [Gordonia sp. (in: high G+C Gram-positive bacteria)]
MDTNPNLVSRLREQWQELAEQMLREGLGSTAPDGLPEDYYTADVLPVIVGTGQAVLEALSVDVELTYDEVSAFVGPIAEQHAEERLPIDVLLRGVHGSAQVLLDAAAALASPDEMSELVAVGKRLLSLMTDINLVIIAVYEDVEASIYRAEREARRELCVALVAGAPAAELAARADTVIAARYLVVSILVADEGDPVPAADLVMRKRMRILQRRFDAVTSGTTPATFDGARGVALIAENAGTADIRDHERLEALALFLTEQYGAPVYLSEIDRVAPEDIPEAANDGAELTRLAVALERPAGAYRFEDLLVEYQITRPSPARDRLARQMAPLLDQPHLYETLVAYLKYGADRKTAAQMVHVHPNTFTYRLRRVADLTGLDPADPKDTRALAAALTVARLYGDPVRQASAVAD